MRGFTLIEVLVSTAIFTVVMVIALGALLAMSESDRKAQTLKSVINNLNFSLDSMTRAMRTGYGYHCGSPGGGDCPSSPQSYFAFTDESGNQEAYCLNGPTIEREVVPGAGTLDTSCSSTGFLAVTAPEVVVTNLQFFVIGSTRGNPDNTQPKVTILLSGYVSLKGAASAAACGTTATCSVFNLETSATQRLYDQ